MIEREIKLSFADHEAARHAVLSAGGRLVASRRLIEDRLFDTTDGQLRASGRALRIRRDGRRVLLTSKGPAASALVKAREEFETEVGDADTVESILATLEYRQAFRSEKYREEFTLAGVVVALDETPIGVFVELEGAEASIVAAAALLGRTPADFVRQSYPALYRAWCHARGAVPGDMMFAGRSDERPAVGSGL
jgi:adenylate cyclase class 2